MTNSWNPAIIGEELEKVKTSAGKSAKAIEALQTFDDAETDTGMKWIDGKNIYRKVFTVAAFPNSTSTTFAHGITNLGSVTSLYGVAFLDPGVAAGKMFVGSGNPSVLYAVNNITLTTTSDMSGQSGFVVIEYTKTTTP